MKSNLTPGMSGDPALRLCSNSWTGLIAAFVQVFDREWSRLLEGLRRGKKSRPVAFALIFAGSAHAQGTSLNPLASLRLEDLASTRERPLFSQNRRAPPAVQPAAVHAAETPAPKDPPFELIGTVVGGRFDVSLLRNRVTSQVSILKAGAVIDGWKINNISRISITLERLNSIYHLNISFIHESGSQTVNASPLSASPTLEEQNSTEGATADPVNKELSSRAEYLR